MSEPKLRWKGQSKNVFLVTQLTLSSEKSEKILAIAVNVQCSFCGGLE